MKLSVVIPTWNAAASLSSCLTSLTEADEVVVADGGSTDRSVAIAEAHGARVVTSPRGRGNQLAVGAAAATGNALLFVHADTLLAPGWSAAAAARAATGCARAAPRAPRALQTCVPRRSWALAAHFTQAFWIIIPPATDGLNA